MSDPHDSDFEEFPSDSAVDVEPRTPKKPQQQQGTFQPMAYAAAGSSLNSGHGVLQFPSQPATPSTVYGVPSAPTPKSSTEPTFPTPDFAILYLDGHAIKGGKANTAQLKSLYQTRAGHSLADVPNVHSVLPSDIDLTTVELLTFFPGIIKDPYFAYRALSTGWDSTTLRRVANTTRDWSALKDAELPRDAWRSPVGKGMEYVLGMKDGEFSEARYKGVAVAARPKMPNYTAAGLSKMYQTPAANDVPAKDWLLSELLKNVTVFPDSKDIGTLTNLLWYHRNGTIKDMKMSDVDAFVKQNDINQIKHGATDDEACFRHWEDNNPNKRGRKVKYEEKIDFTK